MLVDRAINAAKTVDKGVDVAKGAGKGARPPSLSPEGAGRNGAFREAKRKNDIPVTQHPSSVEPNVDKRNKPQPGRIYKFDRGRDQPPVTIREDSGGHFFGPNDPQNRGPHFNDDKKRHYDY